MYVTNVDDILPLLREKLWDYLVLKAPTEPDSKGRLCCIAHDEDTPSMVLNPKNGFQTAHCFGCGITLDIFSAAEVLEGLPTTGAAWIQETIPHLAELLELPIRVGEPSLQDTERLKLYKLAQDITDILEDIGDTSYAESRGWVQDAVVMGSCSLEDMTDALVQQGWDLVDINRSLMVSNNNLSFFGKNKFSFVIKNERGKPVGFMYRNLADKGPKYANTPDTLIYSKGKVLLGLDTAIQDARRNGIYIVEGGGDLFQLKRLGIMNSAAVCGTALTADHLLLLKGLGIKRINLCMDWDSAGAQSTNRVFFSVLKEVQGLSLYVVPQPDSKPKDPDEFLSDLDSPDPFLDLEPIPAFDWVLDQMSDNETPDSICEKILPLIAAEPAAVKREMLMKKLSQHTGFTYTSILSDVNSIRGGKFEQRKERLLAAAEQYMKEVEEDPDNIQAIMAQHEQRIDRIEKEFNRDIIGVNYQLQRYEAIQQLREEADEGNTGFKMGWFGGFAQAMEGGMPWSTGCHILVGGRANSGKTATCITIGTDIAFHDSDATVLMHFTDDSYEQTEPRIKAIIARMLYPNFPRLTIGMIVNPKTGLIGYGEEYWKALHDADEAFKQLISEERLVLLDSEDGTTTSTLEKQARYYRQRYPSRKMMLVCDKSVVASQA